MYIISNTYIDIDNILVETLYDSSLSLSSSIKNALLQEISLNVSLSGTMQPYSYYSSLVYKNKIKNSYGNELLNIVKQHPIIRREYLQISGYMYRNIGYMFNIIPATRCKL
jgi:hypothetical protein